MEEDYDYEKMNNWEVFKYVICMILLVCAIFVIHYILFMMLLLIHNK